MASGFYWCFLSILIIGLIAAWFVKWILSAILRKSGIDKLTEKTGAAHFLSSLGIIIPVSKMIGKIASWNNLILFILVAVESLNLNIAAGLFTSIIGYVPHLIGAILIIGGPLARNIMAGFHARESFATGIRIKVGDREGVLIRIGTYKFVLSNYKKINLKKILSLIRSKKRIPSKIKLYQKSISKK